MGTFSGKRRSAQLCMHDSYMKQEEMLPCLLCAKAFKKALKKFAPDYWYFHNMVTLLKEKIVTTNKQQQQNKTCRCLWRVINPPRNKFKVNLDQLSWILHCKIPSHQSLQKSKACWSQLVDWTVGGKIETIYPS